MKRRKWDVKTKASIVVQGHTQKGGGSRAVYGEHQINQAQYYQWRDKFLTYGGQAFEVHHQEPTRNPVAAGDCPAETASCMASSGSTFPQWQTSAST